MTQVLFYVMIVAVPLIGASLCWYLAVARNGVSELETELEHTSIEEILLQHTKEKEMREQSYHDHANDD